MGCSVGCRKPVRDQVLAICRRHLAPRGIAYVSYNAYPGCHLRAMWREMMLFHTAQFDDPQDKIDQARGMLQMVAHGTGREDATHRLAQEEFSRCAESDRFGDLPRRPGAGLAAVLLPRVRRARRAA